MKEDCKLYPLHENKIDTILQDIDQIFGKLKDAFRNIID